jgi:hypothetical protein
MTRKSMTLLTIILAGGCSLFGEQRPLKLTYSGTMVATTIDIAPGTVTDEEQLAGTGTLGKFTFRKLRVDALVPTFGGCGKGVGPIFAVTGGAGVFRFEDGSLLNVTVTQGVLCVDVSNPQNLVGYLNETYPVVSGTGRFQNVAASCATTPSDCTFKSNGTLSAILFDSTGQAAKLLTNIGTFEGVIPAGAGAKEQE